MGVVEFVGSRELGGGDGAGVDVVGEGASVEEAYGEVALAGYSCQKGFAIEIGEVGFSRGGIGDGPGGDEVVLSHAWSWNWNGAMWCDEVWWVVSC